MYYNTSYFFSLIYLTYPTKQILKEVISIDAIQGFKNLSMDKFEAEVWKYVGCKCDYINVNDYRKVIVFFFLHLIIA